MYVLFREIVKRISQNPKFEDFAQKLAKRKVSYLFIFTLCIYVIINAKDVIK